MDLNEINYELGLFLASAPDMGPEASTCQIQSSSAADLSPKREVQGARRVRNACLQCRERKIRCSRTYPCKGCVSRGDGPACDWQGGFPTGNIPIYQRNVADQRRQIEKLKDRLTSAKACLGSALRNKQGLKLEISPHQTISATIFPIPSRDECLSWSSNGSSNQLPGSATSNISSFSANTADSSQGWSYEDGTICSPLSAELDATIWKERNPSRWFDARHRVTGYRPLSLLREEDELAVGGSRPYAASGGQFTKASGFHHYCTSVKSRIPTSWSSDFLDPLALDRRILQSYDRSNFLPYAGEASTPEAVPRHESMSAPRQIPLLPSQCSNWQSGGNENARIVQNHGRPRGNLSEVESRSPITPSRHSHDVFSLPYISSLRTDQISPTEVRSMCQHYLPQSQYLGSHGIDPATDPNKLNSRDFPWFIPI
ncbi:hypothetical protein MJO28_016036 [Puccinia striiformis f. sp. tritici]|uniref:Zn(2)-C6 fungal-type domain-containing protein n=3 Tax=Puccinia striiformis TaxID=27350 RepID=A0A0L0W1R2_9BASI|nr:hypothetical protein Pst134EA_028939 [Puccinia striiformis f. sp. tritici]KAI9623366.1 hypothetical protein H4Q26_014532 [Puccinia striiformis f. sp. tritici PST-130]KNF05451.1 hypothetical protein PSTG_01261 [Puccinia striiformis f. sp. tritici PST-78]POW12939.1 hypothetical protein PSTT_04188 [Puccinia striiformis]KAH9440997.1 hypothetical protein Pst134EB_029649 [Puccinia striiformis f. sp. tritici]KAH9446953.1 hypothetical protein Pst134EA_028939 [Puccinia striiformis f. sp. tritici]